MASPTFKTHATPSNFGGLANDGNRNAMQFGSWFQTSDATGTPKNSPLTVSNSTITIVVPVNATQITLYPTTNDTRVSELSDMSTYFTVKAGTLITIDVARLNNLYLLRDAGSDVTLQFYFSIV